MTEKEETEKGKAGNPADPLADPVANPTAPPVSNLVKFLGVCLIVAVILILWGPDPVGDSPYTPAIIGFLIATIAANVIPLPPKDNLRLTSPKSLSSGAVGLLCFLLVVVAIMVPRLADRYAELERVRMCARVAAIALHQQKEGDPKGRHVQCRTGR